MSNCDVLAVPDVFLRWNRTCLVVDNSKVIRRLINAVDLFQ